MARALSSGCVVVRGRRRLLRSPQEQRQPRLSWGLNNSFPPAQSCPGDKWPGATLAWARGPQRPAAADGCPLAAAAGSGEERGSAFSLYSSSRLAPAEPCGQALPAASCLQPAGTGVLHSGTGCVVSSVAASYMVSEGELSALGAGSCSGRGGEEGSAPPRTNPAALPGDQVPAQLSPLALREDLAVSRARLVGVLVKPPPSHLLPSWVPVAVGQGGGSPRAVLCDLPGLGQRTPAWQVFLL